MKYQTDKETVTEKTGNCVASTNYSYFSYNHYQQQFDLQIYMVFIFEYAPFRLLDLLDHWNSSNSQCLLREGKYLKHLHWTHTGVEISVAFLKVH